MSHDDDARGAVKGLSFPSYLSNQVVMHIFPVGLGIIMLCDGGGKGMRTQPKFLSNYSHSNRIFREVSRPQRN